MSTFGYGGLAVRETPRSGYPRPRLLDRVREAVRARHYSRRTEKAYVAWTRRYVLFHGKRHPIEMGAAEVSRFLTSLATEAKVAASTQNQALNALLFLYRVVLEQDLPWLNEVVRARRPQHLPVVLSREEVRVILDGLDGTPRLMALLLYGAGLRLLECARLRVKDVDFASSQILVRSGKGARDRVTMLPPRPGPRSYAICRGRGAATTTTSDGAPAGSSSRTHWPGSIRTPPASGAGSGSSRQRGSTSITPPASADATTCTSRYCSAP
jgi:integrase